MDLADIGLQRFPRVGTYVLNFSVKRKLLPSGSLMVLILIIEVVILILRRESVQSALDGIAVVYQLSLTGGVPFLFILHMLSRRKQTSRVLLWVLVPLLFMGTAIAVVFLVAIMHPSS